MRDVGVRVLVDATANQSHHQTNGVRHEGDLAAPGENHSCASARTSVTVINLQAGSHYFSCLAELMPG